MASEEPVEAAQLRGTNTAKVSSGTGTLQRPLRSLSSSDTHYILSLKEEECEKVAWTMNFL